MHTWSATQCVRLEHVFSKYYVGDFDWTLVSAGRQEEGLGVVGEGCRAEVTV